MCASVRVCVHTCMRMRTCVCARVCVYVCRYLIILLQACEKNCTQNEVACLRARARVCVCVCMCVCVDACLCDRVGNDFTVCDRCHVHSLRLLSSLLCSQSFASVVRGNDFGLVL